MTAASPALPPDPAVPAGRWSDLDRPALDAAALNAVLQRDGSMWRTVEVLPAVGSTNAELVARAAADEPEGLVLVTEDQQAGRGRLDRVWTSPPRAGIPVSVLLRPDVPVARRGWLSLLAGIALAESLSDVVRTSLKWPNDVLAPDGRKLAGILSEASGAAVVVGVGVNVSTRADELPETGTSLSLAAGRSVDRGPVLLGYLRAFEARYRTWVEHAGDPVSSGLARDYLAWCSTVGLEVAVTLPDGTVLEGVAEAVDWDGRLVVRTPQGRVELAVGDVRHVRPRTAG